MNLLTIPITSAQSYPCVMANVHEAIHLRSLRQRQCTATARGTTTSLTHHKQ